MIKLNIGCNTNIFPFFGWMNYDICDLNPFFDNLRNVVNTDNCGEQLKKVIYYLKHGSLDFRVHDLRSGFPQHQDDSVDAIYLGQVIEHLNPIVEAPRLIKECHRMLKPEGVVRITTPDLDILINAYIKRQMGPFSSEQPESYADGFRYADADPSDQLSYLMYGASGVNSTRNNYEGHMHLYTQKSMTTLLRRSGFQQPFFFYRSPSGGNVSDSISPVMEDEVTDVGMTHSFISEAIKKS